jgi:diadenosine tetraphosphate (Ap4A) HIT family hydrolase
MKISPIENTHMITPVRLFVQSHIVEADVVVYEGDYWRVVLHEKQNPHFLRSIVRLKRACGSPVCITQAERRERDAIEVVLHTFAQKNGATYSNFMRLMNKAYRLPVSMPSVHYHFIPRYKDSFFFGEILFHDKAYGHHYHFNKERTIPYELMILIKDIMKKEFNKQMPKPPIKVVFYLE